MMGLNKDNNDLTTQPLLNLLWRTLCLICVALLKKECGRSTLRGNKLNKSWVCVRDRPTAIQMKDLSWDIRAESN